MSEVDSPWMTLISIIILSAASWVFPRLVVPAVDVRRGERRHLRGVRQFPTSAGS